MRRAKRTQSQNESCRVFWKTEALYTAGAPEIIIDQSGFSSQEKLYCPEVKRTLTGKAVAVGQLVSLKAASQTVKSEKYETFNAKYGRRVRRSASVARY